MCSRALDTDWRVRMRKGGRGGLSWGGGVGEAGGVVGLGRGGRGFLSCVWGVNTNTPEAAAGASLTIMKNISFRRKLIILKPFSCSEQFTVEALHRKFH